MNELSLHILDIVQNSIRANASLVQIIIDEQLKNNIYSIKIHDDGHGMNAKTLSNVSDPFYTSRTTRKVGMGVSLFKMACELTEGGFTIDSEEGIGTTVTATFTNDHIDRAPLGEIEESLCILILNDKDIDILYKHTIENKEFVFDTREVKQVLEGIPLNNFDVIMWIKNNIKEGINTLKEELQ